MSDLVPFGKHKGKPLNTLLDDREYLDWVLQQPWFRQKYTNIYQIVINNGQEPSETPEHNLMQAQYLDVKYAHAVVNHVIARNFPGPNHVDIDNISFEPDPGGDVSFNVSWGRYLPVSSLGYNADHATIIFELKPALGDDYPAVLRAMKRIVKRDKHGQPLPLIRVLVVRDFNAAISREQLVKMFNLCNIHVLFENDVRSKSER